MSTTFHTSVLARLSRRRTWAIFAGVLILCAGVAAWQTYGRVPATGEGVAAKPAAPTAVPVDAAMVARKDVPIFLAGLGTVQAFNTVTVKVRVDGELQKVAFVEG